MPWRRFLIFNAAGGIVWATVYGGGAYLLGTQIERVSGELQLVFIAAGVVALVVGAIVVRRHIGRLEAAAEEAFPGPLST